MKPLPIPGMIFQEATDPNLILKAKRLEFEVFSKTGYEGSEGIITEYECYPSRFFVALFEDQVVGVIRKIQPSPLGFTTTNKMSLDQVWFKHVKWVKENHRCEEGATTAVLERFRAKNRFSCVLHLFKLILEDATNNGVTHWFAPIEPAVFELYKRIFGVTFDQIGPVQDYLGAPTIPCMANLPLLLEGVYSHDPELGDFFTENLGDCW